MSPSSMKPSGHKSGRTFQIAVFCVALFLIISLCHGQASLELQNSYLGPHNDARTELGVGIQNLTWNTELESFATNWAVTRASSDCALMHSGGPYGENIFKASWQSTPEQAVAAWVDEKRYYHYDTNTCDDVCGHYTQVIWRNTETVGCGSASCADGSTFVVCSYNPPGNFVGEQPY